MKKKKSTKKAILERKYSNAVRALWRKARRMSMRGYVIDTIFFDKPKRVTAASIRRVKKESEELYKKSEYIVPDTGEVLSGEEGRKLERRVAAQKAARTRKIKAERSKSSVRYNWQIAMDWLNDIVEHVDAKGSLKVSSAIRDIIDSAVVCTSEREVGLAIVNAEQEIRELIESIAESSYSAQSTQYSLSLIQLSNLLGGGPLSASQLAEYESADEDGGYEYR